MLIEIDTHSGFCYGVRRAIDIAEKSLSEKEELTTIGDLVHNKEEIDRLLTKGMSTVSRETGIKLIKKNVLIRAHGEPPETFTQLKKNNNIIIDATCPVVLKLQDRIRESYNNLSATGGQLVIIGKDGHAEVVGLAGQTHNQAIIVYSIEDLNKIDFSKPIEVFSQTTSSLDLFNFLSEVIKTQAKNKVTIHDTICRQVSNRTKYLTAFSNKFDLILFVSDNNSSNGKYLYEVCLQCNPKSYFITSEKEIEPEWFLGIESIGICGATSTPQWLMEKIALHVRTILNIPV